jgi:hypothetical protein
MNRSSARLVVDVKLLPQPCLWCWEIRDTRSGSVETSWERDWTAYDSPQQALAAGLERVALLSRKPPVRARDASRALLSSAPVAERG